MKTIPGCSLKYNIRIQELNRLAMIAEYRKSEMRQGKNVVSHQRRANRFLQAVFDFAMTLRYGITPARNWV